jgi:hypothetical protein
MSFKGWTDAERAQWAWEQRAEAARVQFEAWLVARGCRHHGDLHGPLEEGVEG